MNILKNNNPKYLTAITKATVKSILYKCDRTKSNVNGHLVSTKSYLTLKQ